MKPQNDSGEHYLTQILGVEESKLCGRKGQQKERVCFDKNKRLFVETSKLSK